MAEVTEDGRVEITLRDVWNAQHETTVQIAAIGTQLATLATRVDGRLDAGQTTMADHEVRMRLLEKAPSAADHEGRVRALEKFRYTLVGGVVMLQAMAMFAEYLFAHK